MKILYDLTEQLSYLVTNSKSNIIFILEIIAGIWLLNIINWSTGSHLNILGTIPRTKRGILGIIFSWALHANFNHLFFNTIPLFSLSLVIIAFNKNLFFTSTILILLMEGTAVWLLARKGNHIGASGLIAGYFGLILTLSYKIGSVVSILLGFIVLYYFSGILLSFFPEKAKTSWESHLFGFIAGIITFILIYYYKISFRSLLDYI